MQGSQSSSGNTSPGPITGDGSPRTAHATAVRRAGTGQNHLSAVSGSGAPAPGNPIRGADRRVTNMWPDPAVLRADTCALPWFLDVARIIRELGYEPFSWRLGCIVIPAESRRPAVKADFPGRSHRSPDQEPGRERGREATDSAPVDIPIQPAPCPLATGPTESDFSPPEAPLSGFPPFPSPTTSTSPLTQRRVARQHRCSQISYCLYTETTPQSIQTCGPTLP